MLDCCPDYTGGMILPQGVVGGRESQRPLNWTHIPCVCTCEPSVHPFMSASRINRSLHGKLILADDKCHTNAQHQSEISRWSQTSVRACFSRTNSIIAVSLIALPVCFHRLWSACGISFISNCVPFCLRSMHSVDYFLVICSAVLEMTLCLPRTDYTP